MVGATVAVAVAIEEACKNRQDVLKSVINSHFLISKYKHYLTRLYNPSTLIKRALFFILVHNSTYQDE